MIQTLEVRGFRLLDDFEADLGQITVVIGANATGKSTLLDCLQVICQSAERPINDVLESYGGMWFLANASAPSGKLEWHLTFVKPQTSSQWKHVPLAENRAFTYSVTLSRDRSGQAIPVYEVLRNAKPHGTGTEPFKLLESTPQSSKIFDHRKHSLVPFDAVVSASDDDSDSRTTDVSVDDGPNRSIGVAPTSPALRLSQMRFFNEYPEPSWIRLMLASWAFYPGFEVGKNAPVRTQAAEIRMETLLSATGHNLGTVLHELVTRHDYRQNAEDLKGFLRSAYPSFEGIYAETAAGVPGKALVRLREAGMQRAMELWDLSDGMLRFLCLAAALLNPAPPPFVAIDEPETGLHPRLLPIVADMIKTASEQTQVLITTHSPDLLNCFALDEVAVMVRDDSRTAWRRPRTRESLRQMLEAVTGETLGDLHRSGELEAYE